METITTDLLFQPSKMNDTEKFFTVLAMRKHKANDFCVPLEKAMKFLQIEPNLKHRTANALKGNFEEGYDFICIQTETNRPGRPYMNYKLTVECFKQFCMLSKSIIGKQVRRYYIDMEDALHDDVDLQNIGLYKILAMLLAVDIGLEQSCMVYPMIEERIMRTMSPEKIALAFQDAKNYKQPSGGHSA